MLYCEEFADKLNDSFLEKYKKGELLSDGKIFKWANKNNVFDIKILSFNGKYVRFKVIDENSTHKWTIDNFYIFDDVHLKKLFDNAREYDYNIDSSFPEWSGIYILCDNEKNNKYYVGQSINIKRRLNEHLHGKSSGIDKRIHETNNFTLKYIKLKGSGYSSLDALETAFIAYLKSYFNGYNGTRGNIAPQKAVSKNIKSKLETA